MSAGLEETLDSYLALRRSLGYKLDEAEFHIRSFIRWHQEQREGEGVTVQDALEWACLPGRTPVTQAKRLRSIRGWAAYAHFRDSDIALIPVGLLPINDRRPTPYIFRNGEIRSMMNALADLADTGRSWRARWHARTCWALIGLLACTGIRVGEAIALKRADIDIDTGWVKIVSEKNGRERLVMLHPSAIREIGIYLGDPARPRADEPEPAFVSSYGRHVSYDAIARNFKAALATTGLQPQGQAHPTFHSFRHSFAVEQLSAAYRDGVDPARPLTLLSTWLGHVSPKCTYWYLTATQELLSTAADLVEREVAP